MKLKKIVSAVLSITVLCAGISMFSAGAASGEDTVTIYHTNDMHADVENLSYVSAIKENTPNALLVDAGDAVQGSALATYTDGDAIVQMMNASGYDLGTLGNHEFDYSGETALKNAETANFPMISANTYNKDGGLFLQGINGSNGAYSIQEVNGHKIGFFGLTTTETAYKTNPQNLDGVTFKDEVETAKRMVETLQEQDCDVIVALCHVGIDSSTVTTSHIVAQQVDGIDVLIDGHSHSKDETVVNGTHICQTGTKLETLGEIKLNFSEDGSFTVDSRLIPKDEYQTMAQPKAEVAELYQKLNAELEPILNEKVGVSNTKIFYSAQDSIRTVRLEETPCANLVTDAMEWSARQMLDSLGIDYPVVVLENGGGIRADLPEGTVTKGDILNVLPYSNTIQISEITPQKLYATLENGVKNLGFDAASGYLNLTTASGAYPQIAGMEIIVDLSREAGARVTEIRLDQTGECLDPADDTTKIAIASNDYELSGGDGYTILGTLPKISEGGPLDSAVQKYIDSISAETGSFSYAKTDGRIFIQQFSEQYGDEQNPYLQIDLDLDLSANTEYTVCVDDVYTVNVTSDADGVITLAAADPGYHTVYVTGGDYYYTSTYTGIHIADWAKAVMGDVNKDGKLDIQDATQIQLMLVNAESFDYEQTRLSDTDRDGVTDICDVTQIQLELASAV